MPTDIDNLFVLATYSLRTFVALFWGVFLLFYRRKTRHNLLLSLIFLIVGALYLRNGFVRVPVIDTCDVYNLLSYLVMIFIAPFTIFYIRHAVGEKSGFTHKLLHFIPFATMLALWLLLRLSPAPRIPFCFSIEDIFRYRHDYTLYAIYFPLLIAVFLAQIVTYAYIGLTKLLAVKKSYLAHDLPAKPVNKLIAMGFLFMTYPLICMVFMSYNNNVFLCVAHNFIVLFEITAISILGMDIILPLKPCFTFAAKAGTRENVLQPESADAMAENIRYLFDVKELYRLPHFTLNDLANHLGTNRTYVSSCINGQFGCSFNQLLKIYRIDRAKELLLTSQLSIKEIMWESGFGTRTSFYNAFREMVDPKLSPSEWRAKQAL